MDLSAIVWTPIVNYPSHKGLNIRSCSIGIILVYLSAREGKEGVKEEEEEEGKGRGGEEGEGRGKGRGNSS